MKRSVMVASLVGTLGTAHAQAPGAAEPVASFLERRVPEELAVEGVLLSRQNVRLRIDQVGDVLIVSLVDVSTSRVVASTKLDAVPADREAAVATTTHVVADLMTQIATSPPVAAPAPAPAPPPAAAPDPQARELAELRYKRESIRFGNDYEISVSKYGGSVHRLWVTYQGELDQRLDPEDFYRTVGRPDLVDAYEHRYDAMVGGYVVGGLGLAGSLVAFFAMRPMLQDSSCVITDPSWQACEDAAHSKYDDETHDEMLVSLGVMGVGAIGFGVGLWYHYHPHPISENEAKQLADQHNQSLRRQLGLPVVATQPRVRDLQLSPVATGSTSGLVLSGRF